MNDAPAPLPVFRLAFAIVGALVFGASTLVGVATLVAGSYTTTLRCDRAREQCTIQLRDASRSFPLADLQTVERIHEISSRNRSAAYGLYAVHRGGQRDFLCAVPDEEAPRLEALAQSAEEFQKQNLPSLDLSCQGRVATVANSALMIVLSAILTTACLLTLYRGFRQRQAGGAGQAGGETLK